MKIKRTTTKYKDLYKIPIGRATDEITEGCLALEGGAFRGLYTQGVLDVFMENGINLSCVLGVSAGALGGMNYISGQIGRTARTCLAYRYDSRYIGSRALIRSKSILDVSFLLDDRGILLEPFDEERFETSKQRFVAVTTNCETGTTTYFEKGRCSDIKKAVKASASMPFLTPEVEINGYHYLDGGCSCKIPYQWAINQGYQKIILVRTRDLTYRKPAKESSYVFRAYAKYPQFAEGYSHINREYNRQCEETKALAERGRIFVIAPSRPVTISRIEKDIDKMADLYWLGVKDAIARLEDIKEYLGL
ncbi:MAG: patatin family protein [Firmicutes bacterium]|nr:patatin family protein [Bacillota bacterium]